MINNSQIKENPSPNYMHKDANKESYNNDMTDEDLKRNRDFIRYHKDKNHKDKTKIELNDFK